jgi:N-acyl-D-aspartate/D-glutamate deacylase
MGINLASYVGATQVRRMILGDGDRAPSPAELDGMRSLVREAMQQGAVGVSTSLQYAPAPYAKTEELSSRLPARLHRTAACTPRTCAVKATTSSSAG